jgi:hypothetical protein
VKAALIPPKGYEVWGLRSDIHLALPLKETRGNSEYQSYLLRAAARGDYIIMDNGCAEGRLVDNETLVRFAIQTAADEIVAPDVMGDPQRTLSATKLFMDYLEQNGIDNFKIMGVLQGGATETKVKLLKEYDAMEMYTIGIPKAHVRYEGDDTRARTVSMIQKLYPGRFEIHLLGLNKRFPNEINQVKWPDGIRSMDSTQPFKAAEGNMLLSTATPWCERRKDYFAHKVHTSQTLLQHNVEVFMSWAEG